MAASRTTGPDSGTYLFVNPDARPRRTTGRTPAMDSILEPLEPASSARLRHRRPQLDPRAIDGRLVFFLDPDCEAAMVYREAADRLLACSGGARRIWVTSPAAGAGRTTTALNLASALAEGRRVTVVDLDLASPGIAPAFALEGVPALSDVVKARRRDRATPVDLVLLSDRLAALPAGPEKRPPYEVLGYPELRRIVEEADQAADLVLIDGPIAKNSNGLGAVSDLVDGVVLVVRPADLGSGAAERAIVALRERRLLGVVVNGAAVGARA